MPRWQFNLDRLHPTCVGPTLEHESPGAIGLGYDATATKFQLALHRGSGESVDAHPQVGDTTRSPTWAAAEPSVSS
jgi:hypothetical protein